MASTSSYKYYFNQLTQPSAKSFVIQILILNIEQPVLLRNPVKRVQCIQIVRYNLFLFSYGKIMSARPWARIDQVEGNAMLSFHYKIVVLSKLKSRGNELQSMGLITGPMGSPTWVRTPGCEIIVCLCLCKQTENRCFEILET